MLGLPAVESFDFMIKHGLPRIAADIQPLEFEIKSGQKIKVKFNKVRLHYYNIVLSFCLIPPLCQL